MLSITKINEYPTTQTLLANGKWRKTDYYTLCCDSELWGCAELITLNKQVTMNATEALIYVLERSVNEFDHWDDTIQSPNDAEMFARFVLEQGYLRAEKGRPISIQEFWSNYEEVTNGIFKEESLRIFKNEVDIQERNLLQKEDLTEVICFANSWNNRQYFLETEKEWVFFDWGTGA
jgi:hypothetical protein